jgi:hypothetical protein
MIGPRPIADLGDRVSIQNAYRLVLYTAKKPELREEKINC